MIWGVSYEDVVSKFSDMYSLFYCYRIIRESALVINIYYFLRFKLIVGVIIAINLKNPMKYFTIRFLIIRIIVFYICSATIVNRCDSIP